MAAKHSTKNCSTLNLQYNESIPILVSTVDNRDHKVNKV